MGTNLETCRAPNDELVELLHDILTELDASGCTYALIHAGASVDDSVSSDVDIAFGANPNEVLAPIFRRMSKRRGVRLIQCLHYEIPHGYYYILSARGVRDRFLHLDCLYDPLGVNRYRLPTYLLLEGAGQGPWGSQTRSDRMALHLLLKRATKGIASREAIDALRVSFGEASDALWADVRSWLGDEAKPLVARLLQAQSSEEAAAILAQLRSRADRNFRLKHPFRHALSLLLSIARKMHRFVQPTGLFVVVIGPDGAGKSTVTGMTMSRLSRAFRRTWRFHWRPGVLPKLSRRTRVTERHEFSEAPPAASRYGTTVSLLRFLYYWADFVAGYWLSIYPRKARTTLVIGERYFPDVLVHPQRYGFALPVWLMRLAAVGVPSPDLVVLLKDDPHVIHARKSELSPAVLAEQIAAYEDEIERWGKPVTIVTEGGVEAVVARVCDVILDECAGRATRRLNRYSRRSAWLGFPSATGAKVWIGYKDTFTNALNLYHPYSSSGRFAKGMVRFLPALMHRTIFRQSPSGKIADHLDLLTSIIRETLRSDEIAVSFSTGTAGLHRKLTAQASRDGKVQSYVKIGTTQAHAKLLEREAHMLERLQRRPIGAAAVLPTILAVKTCEQHHLLFLSAPAPPGKPRPLEPDDRDARFLSALIANDDKKISASELFQSPDFSAFRAATEQCDVSLAAMLRDATQLICDAFAAGGVRVARCHGDYAPWNTLELQDGGLYVFDWEYSSDQAPLFTDLFHRVLMPARLVRREPPSRVIGRLLQLSEDPVLGSVITECGVERAEMPKYLLLYLIRLAMQETEAQGKLSDFVRVAFEHVLRSICSPTRRLNVLVAAYACEPGRGSEPGVGWNMCQAISREHNAWVITRRNNRPRIEQALAQHPNTFLQFRYADLPQWASSWKRGGRGIRLYYYLWQFAALREARRLTRSVPLDLAHHVTFVNGHVFSFLALVKLPFVWGPVGANAMSPVRLAPNWNAVLSDRLRYSVKQLVRIFDPLYWICAYRARLIVAINSSVRTQFPLSLFPKNKFVDHTAIGVEASLLVARSVRGKGNAVRILTMGQMIPIKGFHLAIRAFVQLRINEPEAVLVIVGDGPEKAYLEQLAVDLGVAASVEFVAWLPRDDAMSVMSHADVFLFPSFEGAGMVVLEAMAHGLPVVCLDFGGPGDMVTPDCGFVVKVGTLDDSVSGLGAALTTLARDPSMRLRMGIAGKRRVEQHYLWQKRHEAIRQWYAKVLPASLETSTHEGSVATVGSYGHSSNSDRAARESR